MKKVISIAFSILLFLTIASAQPCLQGGAYFSTQAQIDNFQINNPNCTEIEGQVFINGADITNLDGLFVVTSMGNLVIKSNDNLLNINGLANLTSVGGDLRIYLNPMLENLSGLENLTYIPGNLEVGTFSSNYVGNAILNSLSGLVNLDSIGGDFLIYDNDVLETLSGPESLVSIGGSLQIQYNSALTTLTGLEGLTLIGNNLRIGGPFGGNLVLSELTGLNNVTSIGGNLEVQHNNELIDLSGLDNLSNIGGNFWLYDVDNLSTLTGLENLSSIGGSMIVGYNYYGFGGNASLVDFTGLNNLNRIGEDFKIQANGALINFAGLESLTSIDGSLIIGYYVGTPFGGVFRDGNPSLNSLAGLNSLSSIGGSLAIYCNDTLHSLDGLESLTSIGGDLKIGGIAISAMTCSLGNPFLHSIEGLGGLTSIGGSLDITDNDALTSLSGLDYIDAASITYLKITDNQSLSTCEVKSVCAFLVNQSGNIFINENAVGCNSPEEVQDSCFANAVNIDEQYVRDILLFYPNPANHKLNISAENYSIDEVSIYTLTGQQVLQERPVDGAIDISGLQTGMYIVEVVVENTRLRQKLLVI